MTTIKTAISVQKTLFEQVDNLASAMKVSRRRLLVLALEDYVQRHQNQLLLEQINEAYTDAIEPVEEKRLRQAQQQHRKIVDGTW